MYPEFAYSSAMQLILAFVAIVSSYIFIYLISNLMSQFFGEIFARRQKSIFAFLIGVILNQAWVYLMYFIGGMRSFSETAYALIVTPNPIFAMLYYLIGVNVLRLSPIRSIKLMRHVYLYYILIKSLSRLLGSLFFVQSPGRYNYLLDMTGQLTFMAVFCVIYILTQHVLKRYAQVVKLKDNLFVNLKKELIAYFAKALLIYLLMVGIPILIQEKAAANFVTLLILVLIFSMNILWDIYKATKNGIENRDVCVNALSKGVLTAYGEDAPGFNGRINDNPSLIYILLSKCGYAEKMNVTMKTGILGSVENLIIDNTDACRIVACLLDNAIETAARSEDKWVYFSIETKPGDGRLIIINNSIDRPDAGEAVLYRHGAGISTVRKIIRKYGNCAFHMSYYNNKMSAYLEIRQRVPQR